MALSVNTALSNGSLNPTLTVRNSTPSDGLGTNTYNPQQTINYLQPAAYDYSYSAPAAPYVAPQPTSYSNAYGTYSTQAAADAAAAEGAQTQAYYQDQINNLNGQNGRLDSIYNVGVGNINNSYNQSHNRMDTQYAKAKDNYNEQGQINTTQYAKNRSAIQSQTANRANALQRLLGIAGSGSSSAAFEQAPYAAGLQGTQQLGEAQTGYATNSRNLDKAWQDTTDSYNNGLQDLDNDKFSKLDGVTRQRDQQRATLLAQIQQLNTQRDMAGGANYTTARNNQAGYQTQIDNLLNSIAGMGSQFAAPVSLRTANVGYNAPTLQQYSLRNGTNQNVVQSSNPGTSDVSPIFAPILNQQRDEFGNLIG